jgi:hypothetical protein
MFCKANASGHICTVKMCPWRHVGISRYMNTIPFQWDPMINKIQSQKGNGLNCGFGSALMNAKIKNVPTAETVGIESALQLTQLKNILEVNTKNLIYYHKLRCTKILDLSMQFATKVTNISTAYNMNASCIQCGHTAYTHGYAAEQRLYWLTFSASMQKRKGVTTSIGRLPMETFKHIAEYIGSNAEGCEVCYYLFWPTGMKALHGRYPLDLSMLITSEKSDVTSKIFIHKEQYHGVASSIYWCYLYDKVKIIRNDKIAKDPREQMYKHLEILATLYVRKNFNYIELTRNMIGINLIADDVTTE